MKHTHKAPPRSGPAKYPGITNDAQALGVSRSHLYQVLAGKRPSKRLMRLYFKLKAPSQ